MTAIAGFWSFDRAPSGRKLERMLTGQSAYGTQSASAAADGLHLGRRLFPILPEDRFDTAVQSEGGRLLVADIRLDNRDELIEALALAPSEAAESPDSKLLLQCLLRWGDGALSRLVGEFAFAFWEPERQSLLLGRDIMGKRPLYFHRGKHFFAFASMPSGLHALPDIPYDFDTERMIAHLGLLPYRDESCWFAQLKRVLPAHGLRVTREKTSQHRYWGFPVPSETPRRDYAEGLRHTFDEAVRSQLRGAEAGVGTELSSGLDSSAVTATAARQFAGKVYAFTGVPRAGFDGATPRGMIVNEADGAAPVAARYPNVEHVIVAGEGSPLDHLEATFRFYQGPELSLCNAVWGQAINRSARERGLRVLLTGDNGNMTISYAGMELLPLLLRRGKIGELARLWRLLIRNRVSPLTVGAQTLSPFLPKPLWHAIISIRHKPLGIGWLSAVNPAHHQRLERKAQELAWDFGDRARSDPDETRRWALSREDWGNYTKGILGEWGLSVRDPTVDKRVIEYCLSVPAAEFIRDGMPRSLARRAFLDRLPHSILKSQVRGYQGADWYERLAPDLSRAREEIGFVQRCASASEVISDKWLLDTVDSWPSGDWAKADVHLRYRWGLLRGIAAGHFMRKVSGTN